MCERESVCVSVCVCVREREREREVTVSSLLFSLVTTTNVVGKKQTT